MDEAIDQPQGVEQEVVDYEDPPEVQPEESTNSEAEEGEEQEESPENAEDYLEIEHKGKQYKLPKEIEDLVMFQADYAKKTQEAAEFRRALEQREQTFQQQVQFQQQHLQEFSHLSAIDSQLAQYEQVNWQQFSENDPIEAQKAFFTFTQLKDARSNIATSLAQKQQAALFEQQSFTAKRMEQAAQVLTGEIKEWGGDKAKATTEYIKGYAKHGINEADIEALNQGVYGAVPIVWAHKAMLYDKLVNKAMKPATTEPSKPITTIKGKAPATKPLSQITNDEDWIKAREKQLRSNRS